MTNRTFYADGDQTAGSKVICNNNLHQSTKILYNQESLVHMDQVPLAIDEQKRQILCLF